MLILVLADNLVLMFVGWEGVGLCSYLLIGFWYGKMSNAEAGQKAFVVNRVGDAGFLLGIFLLLWELRTANIADIILQVPHISSSGTVELVALLLLLGAIGKSAQIPLFVWLPDAMAGPTPVSALIHAATMVTAGVYMIARLGPLYNAAPYVQTGILCLGAATALVAATAALGQNDIKKVLAYSTISQLGYMFMALGVGAYSYGIFHLVTHSFFKSLLFMAAGSVIICEHEQDMRRFGGLWERMWATFSAYFVGTYAIIGLPLGSGAFSKDGILWAVYSSTDPIVSKSFFGLAPMNFCCWIVGILTILFTAIYMTRTLVLTFFGGYRGRALPHESSLIMLLPMGVLMGLAMFYGLRFGEPLLRFLEPWSRADLFGPREEFQRDEVYVLVEHIAMYTAGAGVVLTLLVYSAAGDALKSVRSLVSPRYNPLLNAWWFDSLYNLLIVRSLWTISRILYQVVDCTLVDGAVNSTGKVTVAGGGLLSCIQTGRLGHYLLLMSTGLVIGLVFWVIL
jgi:NADH-quinone oxidoreductase subunit L